MEKIKVLLVDDHTIVRQGLRVLLEAEPDITMVGEAETGRQAVQMTRKLRPDVVVMDISMPMLNGLEATRQILKEMPATRVLILSSYSDDEYVHQMTQAGAAGYLLKTAPPEELTRAIADVAAGRRVIPPAIAARLADRVAGSELTPRELEVLAAVARGEGNREIARRLAITEGTVKGHVSNVLDKLGVRSRTQAVTAALARGLVRLGRRRPPE